ncbi:MAG: acyl-CoA dehydrogenase [Gammaproteobacteria bacterium]|jgi:alkylation response protein AidB-like acyl-CoA dehydrogenase|nr:acyl-CoA dehydrogenase [Gammaproteobacteria bacterium]MBT4493881.1 acyl-CoA dehydrogenase [Gammaproteobacteria bacterium]
MTEQLPDVETVRQEVRAWLEENWNPAWKGEAQEGPNRVAWLTQVVDAGWAAPQWPKEWFGREFDDARNRVVREEFARVHAFGTGQDRTNLWINTLLAFATEDLKKQLIPGLMRGEVEMCLLYSEPGAGSDLAGVRTKAERDGDEWVVNGQKVWTSGATRADYGMLIARTNWDVPKHRGLSFFFLPMKQPGIEIRPLRQITNESHFNEVFITDARAPAANLLSNEGDGWKVLVTALAYERSYMGEAARGPRSGNRVKMAEGEDELIALAREAGKLSDTSIRQRIAQVIAWRKLNDLNTARAKADLEVGTSASIMSLGKLAMSRILHETARLRTDLLDAESLLEGSENPRAEDANFLALNAYFTSIGGGTDQVQRNIIGERVLGLPKEPEIDKAVPFRDVKGG